MKKLLITVLMFSTMSLFAQGATGPKLDGFSVNENGLPYYLLRDYRPVPAYRFWELKKVEPFYKWGKSPAFRVLIQAANEAEFQARFPDWHPPFMFKGFF